MTGSLPAAPNGLPRLWLVDTSSLLTMAAHARLQDAVVRYLASERASTPQAVVDELNRLEATRLQPLTTWARTAKGQMDWLGSPFLVAQGAVYQRACDIQDDMIAASGRPADHDEEHWAESVILAVGEKTTQVDIVMLSEDYNARISAKARGVLSLSLTRLMHCMVLDAHRSADEVAAYSEALVACHRWDRVKQPAITSANFTTGNLGKRGSPWPPLRSSP